MDALSLYRETRELIHSLRTRRSPYGYHRSSTGTGKIFKQEMVSMHTRRSHQHGGDVLLVRIYRGQRGPTSRSVRTTPPRKQSAGWIIIPTLITSAVLTGGVFVGRTREANTNHALALFKDGTLVISGLQKAQFRPLPFSNGGWMIKQYPAAWQYRDRLQPITSNPKVLNLSIRITIKADHTDPNVVQGLIVQDWNTVAQEIKAGAYELFASELSQGQIGQLNPHRPQAVRGFRDFVRDNLTLPQGICAKNISVNQGGMTVS